MAVKVSKSKIRQSVAQVTTARLFFLSASSGQVFSANPDGSDLKMIVSEGRRGPRPLPECGRDRQDDYRHGLPLARRRGR